MPSDFGLPFPSQGRHAEKRSHSGSCLDRRDRATGGVGWSQAHQKPGEIFDWRGFNFNFSSGGPPHLENGWPKPQKNVTWHGEPWRFATKPRYRGLAPCDPR